MTRKFILLFVIIFSINSAFGQKFSLGKVTIEELAEKKHPLDSAAPAAYLHKTGKNYFELSPEGRFSLVHEVTSKIKIYKKEAYNYANVEVPYYIGGVAVKLNFDDAATYNLVDNKVVKTKLKSDGEFQENINENYGIKKIALPNVKEGSIIEYKYTLKTPYFTYFPDWYFQHSIPVNNVDFEVVIPEFFKYQLFLKGFEDISISPETVIRSFNNQYNQSKISYSGKNIKAIKSEPYVNNMDNYTSMLQYEIASSNFPSEGFKNYSIDWASVTTTIYDSQYFGKELNKKSYFEKDIELLLSGLTTREEKMNAIFNFVKERMNWNEKYGYYTDLGVKKAYDEKVGNVADINLILTAMLRYANIKANPILVSTRSNGITIFPNRGAYNYVIAGVESENNKIVLLDATSKNTLPNIIPIRAVNWTGRMIREDKTSKEINLMPQTNSKEAVNVFAKMDQTGTVSGTTRIQYMDYKGYVFRENYGNLSQDAYLEQMEKEHQQLEVGKYEVTHIKEVDKPLIEVFEFTNNNMVDRIGDKMYFYPMLFYTSTVNPFKEESRKFPLDFSYPFQEKYNITLEIPDGYEIESIPKPIHLSMEDNIGSFKFLIGNTGNKVQVSVVFDINYANVSADYYTSLKSFFGKVIEKQTEKIVLKKI